MIAFVRDLCEDWGGRILLALLAATILFVPLCVWSMVEKQSYIDSHDCEFVYRKPGKWVLSGKVLVQMPGAKCYSCAIGDRPEVCL